MSDYEMCPTFISARSYPPLWRPTRAVSKHFYDAIPKGATAPAGEATTTKGFELIAATPQPEARAALAKFIVSEIHPFTDGNGRVSRLLMNQILSAAGLTRIIIPTVFREDYTLSLKALSNNANAEPYARMLTRAAKFGSLLDYSSQARLF